MKTVIVTGGSRGIGATIVKELAKNNYNVVLYSYQIGNRWWRFHLIEIKHDNNKVEKLFDNNYKKGDKNDSKLPYTYHSVQSCYGERPRVC